MWNKLKSIGSGLLNLVGVGSQVAGFEKDRRDASRTRRMQQAQFDATMDTSIQRRVKDAQKAGIHPLFAMGASVGSSPTLSAGGGNAGAAARATGGLLQQLSADLTRSQIKKTEAEAGLANSEAALVSSRLASSGRDGVRTYPYPEEPSMELAYGPGWMEEPARFAAGGQNPAIEAGPARAPYVEFRRADGSSGLAFGANVPGAEEMNMIWIPLQNWWHTSKEARRRLREKLGITTHTFQKMERDPEYAKAMLRKEKIKREFRAFRKAASGRPVR